jgi:NAD(P)H-nitrite reductase large subunit
MNLVSGKHEWFGTWGSACYQGRTAGQHMAGKETVYPGTLPENISPFFEWNYAQLGDIQPQGEKVRHIAFGDPDRGVYGLLAFQNDILTGANLINCTHYAGKLRMAILQRFRCRRVSQQGDNPLTEIGAEGILNECLESIRQIPRQEAIAGNFMCR